jgi:type I restriction enzyme, R subunit
MLHGFDYNKIFIAKTKEKLELINEAIEHILAQPDGKKRYLRNVSALMTSFALCVPSEESEKIREDVALFQAIKSIITKRLISSGKSTTELDTAINQIISKAISSEEVVDIFEASGLKKPDVSILSESFLLEIQNMKHKNLAFETLRKLLNDEIRIRLNYNEVLNKKFSELLDEAVKKYLNRSMTAAQAIIELVKMAKEMKHEQEKGKELNLDDKEKAFYDALIQNESAVKELKDDTLRLIAIELSEKIQKNTTIDWEVRESVRAGLRIMVRRILKRYNYPPDQRKSATELILKQADSISRGVLI